LDAGFRNLGVAVFSVNKQKFVYLNCFSSKRGPGSVADDSRNILEAQVDALRTIIDRFNVKSVIAELPVGSSRSSRAIRAMSMAFATIVVFCRSNNLPLIGITPRQVKKLVRSSGKVSKEDIQNFIVSRYGRNLLEPIKRSKREHVADALACLAVVQQSS
jgi:Holliday junction resolvasome RuvABC endonuclease subunit